MYDPWGGCAGGAIGLMCVVVGYDPYDPYDPYDQTMD